MDPAPNLTTADPRKPDLREFVYLDEVSLLSLLSSQKGEITDSKSEEASRGSEASVDAVVGVNPGVLAKAEVASRYQTNNSSTIQTSRKATVQSRFRDLHQIDGLRIIEPVFVDEPAADLQSLKNVDGYSKFSPASVLRRGRLVELRVKLAADPVFHLGTMVSEFTSMAEDYPDMFAGGDGLSFLRGAQPINKILKRLLAGLVPVRALSVDYVVIDIDGADHIVQKKLIEGLGLESRALEIVGVTEQEAYWKDLRRVLFSDAEFTVLARISHSGLQRSWTPVKLADLFKDVAPDLVEQMNAAGRIPFGTASASLMEERDSDSKLGAALLHYSNSLQREFGVLLESDQLVAVESHIRNLRGRSASVSDQTSAFSAVTDYVTELANREISAERALELRTVARETVGLSLFPIVEPPVSAAPSTPEAMTANGPLLLDVEFVAIYW